MEQEPRSLTYFAMMHGLYMGLALIMNQLVFYIMGKPFSEATGILTYLILLGGIGFAMWTYGKLNTEEGLSYSKALGLGTLVSLFGSILIAFFIYILYGFIEPGLMDKLMAFYEEIFLKKGYTDEVVESMLSMQKKILSPALLGFGQIFAVTILGFLFSLLLAIFFKKEPTNPFYEVDQEEEED